MDDCGFRFWLRTCHLLKFRFFKFFLWVKFVWKCIFFVSNFVAVYSPIKGYFWRHFCFVGLLLRSEQLGKSSNIFFFVQWPGPPSIAIRLHWIMTPPQRTAPQKFRIFDQKICFEIWVSRIVTLFWKNEGHFLATKHSKNIENSRAKFKSPNCETVTKKSYQANFRFLIYGWKCKKFDVTLILQLRLLILAIILVLSSLFLPPLHFNLVHRYDNVSHF